MNKETKIMIGVGVALVILVCLFAFGTKINKAPVTDPVADQNAPVTDEKTVNGYTREQYAYMGYKKEDIDLLFS